MSNDFDIFEFALRKSSYENIRMSFETFSDLAKKYNRTEPDRKDSKYFMIAGCYVTLDDSMERGTYE